MSKEGEPLLPLDQLPTIVAGSGFSLLNGIRILDLTTSVAGPYATMLLSDFGAEVIKIERPEGDDARAWGPPFFNSESLWFLAINRNKKSVELDLTTPDGRELLMRLAEDADVVVTNQPPRVQAKLGLDYASFKSRNESIVFTSITGFGLTGARSELTCYDLIAEGYSGIMDVTGDSDSEPQKVGAPAADMLSGQDAAMATLAALIDTSKTNRGHLIDIALVDTMTRFLSTRICTYLGSGEIPARSGGKDSVIAVYQAFDTADFPITLGLGTNAIWNRFWVAVGKPGYLSRNDCSSNAERRCLREEIVRDISAILAKEGREHWLRLFNNARIPTGPINRVDEVVADQALQDRGLFFNLEDGDIRVPQVGLGIQVNGQVSVPRSAPPRRGQHTDEILSVLR